MTIRDEWLKEIESLEGFYLNVESPSIRLGCATVTNVKAFAESHLDIVKANIGKRWAIPYLHRLQQLREQTK